MRLQFVAGLDAPWDIPRGGGGSGWGEEYLSLTAEAAGPNTLRTDEQLEGGHTKTE